MDIKKFMKNENEKPLDNIVSNGGFCACFGKIACIGDSLSSGELEALELGTRTYHDYFEYSWGQFIARDAGCEVLNFSRGGMTAKEYCESFADINGFWNLDLKCRAYIIALGVNDISGAMQNEEDLGTTADINVENYALNKPTFVGFYGAIISKYKEIQPHAKFFLVNIPSGETDEKREKLNVRHAELLNEIAELFDNCYVIDLRKYAPVYDDEFRKAFFVGGHMNVQGYRLTALMIESYIDYIIRNNPEKFAQMGFIGKLHYYGE